MIQTNPLLADIMAVQEHVATLRDHARAFYLRVMLDGLTCTRCGGKLESTGPSACRCASCSHALDPTVAFQRSPCCNARLAKRKCHYACTECGTPVPSRFLFDERIFDAEYFAERMRESRRRQKQQTEEIRRLLANSRKEALQLTDIPSLDSIEGLVPALDAFIGESRVIDLDSFLPRDEFRLDQYRALILSITEKCCARFSAIPPICKDARQDRVRRFVTLIFMDHAQEVNVVQYGNDLLVNKT